MPDKKKPKDENKRNFFDLMTEVIGWLQIVISPLLIGLIIGAVIYFSNPKTSRLIIAIAVVLISLVIGIIIANKAWKNKGTIHFVSRVMATPELDNDPEEKNDK